jgi:hypothetical protein
VVEKAVAPASPVRVPNAPSIQAAGPAREPVVAAQRPETIAAPGAAEKVVDERGATAQAAAAPPVAAPPVIDRVAPPPPVVDPPELPAAPVPVVTVSGPAVPEPSPEPAPEAVFAEPAPEPQAARRATVLEFADRSSTAAEQSRLAVSAGTHYTEALAAVNVGLSAWPMLRPEAKADYVAVCLLLGTGAAGAVALNQGLAEGAPEPFDGYLACLTSGLRRLPTHRKVVLRQEKLLGRQPYPVGTVLIEPGFLSASAQLDVTTPGADLDVLIWPATARRTSELFMGRAFEETVFHGGCRLKVLGLRADESEQDGEVPRPRQALLVRELLPGEDPGAADARDELALAKLDQAWHARRTADVRLVDDEDHVARLTTPMPEVTS